MSRYFFEAATALENPMAWAAAGIEDPRWARQWWEAGFDPSEAGPWIQAARYILQWSELPNADPTDVLRVARVWKLAGFTTDEVRAWRDVLMDWDDVLTVVHEARRWRAAGFDPDSARLWLQSGLLDGTQDLEFAVLFDNAGWTPFEASALSMLSPERGSRDWDDVRRAWIALDSQHALNCVKAGLTPDEARELEAQNLDLPALLSRLRSRYAERVPIDPFVAMHLNHAVYQGWYDVPDADLPFWAQHVRDLHDEHLEAGG